MSENLRVAFDLHPVGPRDALSGASDVWFGLNVASGYEKEPAGGDPADLIEALLPDSLLPQNTTFRLYIMGTTPDTWNGLSPDTPGSGAFAGEVRAAVKDIAVKLAEDGRLKMGWDGDHVEEGDEETDDETPVRKPWPWLGLSTNLAGLPAAISQDLRSRWYVSADVDKLRDVYANDFNARVLLAPEAVEDANRGKTFKLKERAADGDRFTLTYRAKADDGTDLPDLLGYAHALPLKTLFAPAAGSTLKDYWLKVSDSRADSLADIDDILRKNGSPQTLAGLPPADLVTAALSFVTHPERRILPSHVKAVRAAAVALGERQAVGGKMAQAFVDSILGGFEGGLDDLRARTATEMAKWWADNLNKIEAEIGVGSVPPLPEADALAGDHFAIDARALAEGLATVVDRILKVEAKDGPVLPAEGLDFLIGEKDQRLMAQGATAADERVDFNEMSEFGLLVRRASTKSKLSQAPWRAVTAGVPALDPSGVLDEHPWGSTPTTTTVKTHDAIVLRGMALAFKDAVLRNDDTYPGQMMVGPRALSFIHDQRGEGDEDGGWGDPGSQVHYVAPFPVAVDDKDKARAPILRYGDWYGLASPLLDRVGGLPSELSNGKPWRVDLSKLPLLEPKGDTEIEFLRRVPLGDLNLKPSDPDAGWPALPAGIVLRAAEWHEKLATSGATPPALLFREVRDVQRRQENLTRYAFIAEPPSLDEHTLQRWALPALGDVDAAAKIAKVQAEYARIMVIRNRMLETGKDEDALLPHDPAVWGLLLERITFDETNTPVDPVAPFAIRFPTDGDFRKKPIRIAVDVGAVTPFTKVSDTELLVAAPKPGQFSVLRVHLLCDAIDHERFDAEALGYQSLPTHSESGATYVVHPGETVLLETVSAKLPSAADLYEGLSVQIDDAGRALVAYDRATPGLAFVHNFELDRQRWTWRNLPFVTAPQAGDIDERRLISGLPLQLKAADQATRDKDRDVLIFDSIAELDHSFVGREVARGVWPRGPDGAPVAAAQLLADDRDAMTPGDYLRYRLTVTSRYAPLLAPASRSVTAAPATPDPAYGAIQGGWRRAAAPYRGREDLRTPDILAVLPLTASPRLQPGGLAATEGATPFLVVVREIAKREYGPGEGLRAELVLEDREIGEDPKGKRLRRFGPMPHKHVKPTADSQGLTDAEAEPGTAEYEAYLRVPVFGPFGYSLDTSPNEALANASAYLVYLPAHLKATPHWSVGVRFRRVLYSLTSGAPLTSRVGPPSSTYLLYTLADRRSLIQATGRSGAVTLQVKVAADGKPKEAISFQGGKAQLSPYVRDGAKAPADVQAQYRYVLLVGHQVRDGGRNVETFLPKSAYWLDSSGAKMTPLDAAELFPVGRNLRAQILEIEVSDPGATTTGLLQAQATSLIALFKALLQAPEDGPVTRDALGRITRTSDPVEVTVTSV